MHRYLVTAFAAVLAILPAGPPMAAEIAGIKVPESAKVGDAELVLNGAGVRIRLVFKVYVGALYLAEKKTSAAAALEAQGAKRVAMFLMRDLTAEELTGALTKALDDNLPESERTRFKPQIDQLKAVMGAIGAVKENGVVTLDYVPGAGTRIAVDGTPKGMPIAGEDFYRALMKIWIGDKPVDGKLKAALLGQG